MSFLQTLGPLAPAGIVAKATLLLAIGWSASFLLRRAPAVARHLVWLTVIGGVLLIPVVARVAPMNVPVLPSAVVAVQPPPAHKAGNVNVREEPARPSINIPSFELRSSDADTPRGWTPSFASAAFAIWITIALALVTRLAMGFASVRRIVSDGQPLNTADWINDLAVAAERLQVDALPRLVMSERVEMAFAFDAFAPSIVVPVSAGEWSDDRRRAVLLHELAHIRRRDLLGHTLASIACAVYWFNPFVWAAARRLRIESELASDDVVLESGVRPSEYAQHLLDMVSGLRGRTPTVALAMARPKEFEGRLVAILDRTKHRRGVGKAQRSAMVGMLGLLTISIAAVAPVPRPREAERTGAPTATMTPAAAQSGVTSTSPNQTPAARPLPKVASSRDTAVAAPNGPPLSELAIATLRRYGTYGIVNPMLMLLRDADSLGLSGRQADSIATLNRKYMIRLNAIWSPVSAFYSSGTATTDETSVNAMIRQAPVASMDVLSGIVPHVVGLLTEEQRRKVRPAIAIYLDIEHLREIGAGARGLPGGVFLPDGGLMRGGGRRGGGGRGS